VPPKTKMPYNYSTLGFDEEEIKMLQDAEQAIDKADKWTYVKESPVHADYSFVMDVEFEKICQNLRYMEHTSVSLAWTMKIMKQIAQEGDDMHTHMMTPDAAKKHVIERTAEMDEKVLETYKNLPAFKPMPKWAKEYLRVYPQVLAKVMATMK